MLCKLWDRLKLREQQLLWDIQAERYGTNVIATLKPDFSRNIQVHYSTSSPGEVARVMQATPAEVKHWPESAT